MDVTKCWEWTACRNADGYGCFSYKAIMRGAHCTAWFLTYGYWSDLCILHSCDNPGCVNPNHLREGTKLDNARDKVARNRMADTKGAQNGHAKLTEADVLQIRDLYSKGLTQVELSEMFGLALGYTSYVTKGKSWGHI
mgnify:FL=1